MLRLRPYKSCDAEHIVGWIKDELTFRRWGSDRFEHFPITPDDLNDKYFSHNGDCADEDNFYPMTAFDENGVVGHMIMRFTDTQKEALRFGFVIVDDSLRGKGYGKQMLALALRFAFDIMKVQKVTIGVFENNPSAYHCYKNLGFKETGETESCTLMGEEWRIIELEMTELNFIEQKTK